MLLTGLKATTNKCVPPSFVLKGNKCILSCAISPVGANSPLNESNEELRMKHSGVYIFIVLYSFFKVMQSKQRWIWSYLSSEDQNKKNAWLNWQETDKTDTGRGW